MRGRHKSDLSPTERLIISALSNKNEPLSVEELSQMTGSARSTLEKVTRRMVRRNQLVKVRFRGLSNYSLPAEPEHQST